MQIFRVTWRIYQRNEIVNFAVTNTNHIKTDRVNRKGDKERERIEVKKNWQKKKEKCLAHTHSGRARDVGSIKATKMWKLNNVNDDEMSRCLKHSQRHSTATIQMFCNFIVSYLRIYFAFSLPHMIELCVRKISDSFYLNCYIIKLCSGCYPLNETTKGKMRKRIKYAWHSLSIPYIHTYNHTLTQTLAHASHTTVTQCQCLSRRATTEWEKRRRRRHECRNNQRWGNACVFQAFLFRLTIWKMTTQARGLLVIMAESAIIKGFRILFFSLLFLTAIYLCVDLMLY